MSAILDVYNDRSLKGLVQILRSNPKYYDTVKCASVDYQDRVNKTASSFAWPSERAYPIHTKEMALLSSLYRTQYPPEMAKKAMVVPAFVDENLKKASYLYGFVLPEKIQVEKTADTPLVQEDYLLPTLNKFPVRDLNEGKIAHNILVKNAHIMGYDHLAEACSNLITKMAAFKASVEDVHPVIYKYAGLTLSNKDVLDAAILRRTDFVAPEYVESYTKLATIADEMDFNRENLLKVAVVLEKLDEKADMRRLYDKHMLNPIDSVFNTNTVYQKTASEQLFTQELAQKVSEEQVKTLLGDDVFDEASEKGAMVHERLIEVVNSLPTDMVEDFVERVS